MQGEPYSVFLDANQDKDRKEASAWRTGYRKWLCWKPSTFMNTMTFSPIPDFCLPQLMDPTTLSLLERLRGSEAGPAWDRFVDLYTPLLYLWATRMGLQGEDAEDLVQEVFLLLLGKLPQFQPDMGGGFRAWLRAVAVNKWRDMQRRRAAALRQATSAGLEDLAVPSAAEAVLQTEYLQHVVARAIELMQTDFQPATWQACWAVVVEEQPAEKVAKELDMTPAAVYAARARVLRRLRAELDGLLD